jgi:hypothetical protein
MNTVALDKQFDVTESLESLEKQVKLTSQDYSRAYSKLTELKQEFNVRKTSLSPADFQQFRSNLEQQEMIADEKLRIKNQVEIAYADTYRRELFEKAAKDRLTRESSLLAELTNIDIGIASLNAQARSIPNQIASASSRKNQILGELVRLKEQA